MVSVAIIGGGVSGLTAAYRLRQRNVAVTLFEAEERAGGVIRSERHSGYLVEYGPSSIEGSDPITQQLLRELELEEQCLTARQPTHRLSIVRGGKAHRLPASPSTFLRSPLFSPPGKLRLLREPLVKAGDGREEESVAAFARRRLGREGCDYLVSTFVTSVLAGDPERYSARFAPLGLSKLEQRYGSLTRGFLKSARERKRQTTESGAGGQTARSGAFSFRDGLQTLTDALFARVRSSVYLNAPVVRLQRTAAGWNVTARSAGREEVALFDAVIYTAPLYRLSSLQIEPAYDYAPLRAVEYAPLALLALGFRRTQVGHSLEETAVFVPVVEGKTLRATLFSSSVYPGRAPEGHVLLTNFIGGACGPEDARRPEKELLARVLSELHTLLKISGQPTFVKHIALERALPQYTVGYGRVLESIERMETSLPGLYLAGNYRQGVSVRSALLSGYEAAGRALSLLVPEPAYAGEGKA